jgi:hypothetical protein
MSRGRTPFCLLAFMIGVGVNSPALAQDEDRITGSWKLQIAPTLGDPLPLNLGDGLRDYKNVTELSGTVSASIGFARLETTAGMRASTNLNDTQKNGSSLILSNELFFGRGLRRFSPFLYANGEVAYTKFFEDNSEDILEYGAGVRIQAIGQTFVRCPLSAQEFCFSEGEGRESQSLVLEARLAQNDSSVAANDYWGPKVSATFMQLFSGSRMVLKISGEYQHKEFDLPVLTPRQDDRLVGTVTMNLARTFFPKSTAITRFEIGARWIRSWSNLQEGRANDVQVLPVLAIGGKF